MTQNKTPQLLLNLVIFVLAFSPSLIFGQIPDDKSIYIHPEFGNNENTGTKESPLKTLYEAAERLNQANGKGAINIILSEGIYGLDATVTFHPVNWHFTREERLTIQAESLPGDTDWNPGKMPVIVSTMPLNFKPYGNDDPLHGASYGIQIEISHATIQGLRILGTPVHEKPADGYVKRNYPIAREGRDLDDLRITQCLFLGDRHAIPNHVAIIASGHGVVVDHCVFYGVKDAVVFWESDGPSEGSEMHHNLIMDSYGAAIWSWSLAEDFRFYNNVVSNSNVFWVLDSEAKNSFSLSNSVLVGYNELVNKGGGPADFGTKADPEKLKFGEDVILRKNGKLELEEDLTNRNYLHLKPGSPGEELGAGLFRK